MSRFKQYLGLYLFGLTKVPMIFFTRPRIGEISEKRCSIIIPYKRRNRNHVKSLYIGSLVVGADVCAGFLALELTKNQESKVIPIFKDLKMDFLKKAMGPTEFVCEQGDVVKAMVEKALETGERQTQTLAGQAYSTVKGERIHVLNFEITLSLKKGKF